MSDDIVTRLHGIEAHLTTIGQRIGSSTRWQDGEPGIIAQLARIEITMAAIGRQVGRITEHLGLTADEEGDPAAGRRGRDAQEGSTVTLHGTGQQFLSPEHEQAGYRGLAWVRDVIERFDAYLDEAAPPEYRDNPLANRWRRLAGGPGCEVHEATEALLAVTGGNPRKGVHGSEDDVLAELGDTAVAALLAIQSQVKDAGMTWHVFLAALAKAESRLP
jgi:hypothetical protein